jgi:hypothetical protein
MDSWRRLLAAVSNVLLLAGLALIAYGIVYWWKDFPMRLLMLLVCGGFGCLGLGAGLWLRRPVTTASTALAVASFALSTALLFVLLTPFHPFSLALALFCAVGAVDSVRRLRRQRRSSDGNSNGNVIPLR